ncbi:unnamed protein product [Rotaria socialis]|uniref:NAD(P)(+)--arginine ADP-ribosyltransferase n=2 Tax=Rotaria socialis TaxID=392032 RepID=A0A821U3K9_9BILA|nr:unnamed protein product [Rotaria socialis]
MNMFNEAKFWFSLEFSNINVTQPTVDSPLSACEQLPLMSLEEALKPVDNLIEELNKYVYIAKSHSKNIKDGLSQDESASIRIYTMDWGDTSIYRILNIALRSEDRSQVKAWLPYLKLFTTALHKLPSFQGVVWRIVQMDLSKDFIQGQHRTWWSASSTIQDASVLEHYTNPSGKRSLFSIECQHGKDICRHSEYPSEKEILLMPGFHFLVKSVLKAGDGMYIIGIKEIDPAC